jgi:hypothetical protein
VIADFGLRIADYETRRGDQASYDEKAATISLLSIDFHADSTPAVWRFGKRRSARFDARERAGLRQSPELREAHMFTLGASNPQSAIRNPQLR